MPANIPSEVYELLEKAKSETNPERKIRIYYEVLAKTPKHKGTEKFLKEIKRKISELKREFEKKKVSKSRKGFGIRREAPIVISMVGVENVGKSFFLNKYCGKNIPSTEIPFETEKPEVGIFYYKDVPFQIIEIPSFREGIGNEGELMSVVRMSDALFVILTPERDIVWQANLIKNELERAKIILGRKKKVEIKRLERGGIDIVNLEFFDGDKKDIIELLKSFRIYNAKIVFHEKISFKELFMVLDPSYSFKEFVVVLNKSDIKKVKGILNVSFLEGYGIERMFGEIWKKLDIKRIYTKKPGKKPEKRPIVFRGKVTVRDVVEKIHKDFLKSFRYAKIWGPSSSFPGQRVGLEFELSDGDIIEIHA